MDKKELKFYVAPALEIVETELEGFLCGSNGGDGGEGGGTEFSDDDELIP